MRNLKRALVAVLVLLLAAVVLFFVLENQQAVSLGLFGWVSPSMPVAVPVLVALIVGLAVGPMLGSYAVLRTRRRIRLQAREAALAGK